MATGRKAPERAGRPWDWEDVWRLAGRAGVEDIRRHTLRSLMAMADGKAEHDFSVVQAVKEMIHLALFRKDNPAGWNPYRRREPVGDGPAHRSYHDALSERNE